MNSLFCKRLAAMLAVSVAMCLRLAAAPAAPEGAREVADSAATAIAEAKQAPVVSVLTVEPGSLIYELDGHTGLRFHSEGRYDYVVNWGVFDFGAPGFLYRFVKGETDYMAWPFETETFLEEYRRQGRKVTEQVLDLTPAQARQVERLAAVNLEPQNRTYRYNYIYDNCATRPLALVEQAIGHEIVMPDFKGFRYGDTGIVDDGVSNHTFRSEMARAHADYPWYQFGIDLALGSGLDREISTRERAYSPLFMRDGLKRAYYVGAQGQKQRIVKETKVLVDGARASEEATPWWLSPMMVCGLVLVLTLVIVMRDLRRGRVTRWYDSVVYSLFFLAGLLLTFLIFISVHEATSPNWLFLWLNPLCVIPAALIWIKRYKRVVYFYQICNFALLIALVVLGLCGVQHLNGAFYMLIAADMALSARFMLIGR